MMNRQRVSSSAKGASMRVRPDMPSMFSVLVQCSGVLVYFRG